MKYTVKIASLSAGGYRATCPSLPGCRVFGLTRKQALDNLDAAVESYLENIQTALPRELTRLMQHEELQMS